MNGAEFIASVIATGRLHGIGIGSPVSDVDRAFHTEYVDDPDDEENLSLRRDYGLVEVYFNDGPDWTVVGASIEAHRLATVEGLTEKWKEAQGVEFSEYLTWNDVKIALSRISGAPDLTMDTGQGDYIEYRASATRVSALVVDNNEDRDDWPGHGDVFSVALG